MEYREIAMQRRNSLLVLLWALLFAKCFLLEFFVVAYEVPINSVFYVWGLSLFMAAFATAVYVNLALEQMGRLELKTRSGKVWAGCFAFLLLLVLSSLAFGWIPLSHLPLVASGLFSIAYGLQYLETKEPTYLCCGAGWFLCAGLLIQIPTPYSMLVFGVCLLAFAAFPSLLSYLRFRAQMSKLERYCDDAFRSG